MTFKAGHRVRFAFPDQGYPSDRTTALAHLAVGAVYTVATVDEQIVRLKEVPRTAFNIALFSSSARVDQREKNRRKAASHRALWKTRGRRCPSRSRWLAKLKTVRDRRRALKLCPECGEPSRRYVYCRIHREQRAKNCRRAWLRKKMAERRDVAA